jgi:hypothetical protein
MNGPDAKFEQSLVGRVQQPSTRTTTDNLAFWRGRAGVTAQSLTEGAK